jgi:ER degradation enhancer, mannosidase alpha-like 2
VLATDRSLRLLSEPYPEAYNGGLLPLALDLANRLLPALDTSSGIPFGSINLRKGVSPTESPITCTAAAGTLILEFGTLSRLTGDFRFERAAHRAALSLWSRRSGIDLLGAHLSLRTGAWTQADAGIGRGIDRSEDSAAHAPNA